MLAQIDARYLRMRPWKLWSRLISYGLFEGRPLTTRGRWINPIVFVQFALLKRLPKIMAVREPVFILGTGRSGTTILGIVLSMHRDVGFLNEPKALWHAIHPFEDLIGSYTRNDSNYRLDRLDATNERRCTAHRLFAAYLASTFSKRVVDKYPELIFRVPFVKEIFPDAKFIFLVRNGWDTCHSIEGWSDRLGEQIGDEIHDWWGVDRRKWYYLIDQLVPEYSDLAPYVDEMRAWKNQTDMAALEWILTMREGMRLEMEFPDSVKRVNYEALCLHPRDEINNLADFLNLSSGDVKFLNYAESTLKSALPKPPFAINAIINEAFQVTMSKLGYVK